MSKWLPVLVGFMVVVALGALFASRFMPVSQSLITTLPQNQITMTLTSSVFQDGEKIPAKYTCNGLDVSPPLNWTAALNQTKSYALILDDPDARGFTHWIIFNIPSTVTGLEEGIPTKEMLPNGAIQGRNDFGAIGYNGPCPPTGTHHYVFHLYALDVTLTLSPGITKQTVLAAMNGHVLAEVDLTGLYV